MKFRMNKLLNVSPKVTAPLDSRFCPAALVLRNYREAVKKSDSGIPLVIGLERENSLLSRFEMEVFPNNSSAENLNDTLLLVERLVKFLLWSHGGWKIYVGGPKAIGEYIRSCYTVKGNRSFDVDLMTCIYERRFEVISMDASEVPPGKQMNMSIGGHFDGCRIGFDLGGSDYKICAVIDGQPVYSEEIPWDPKNEPDPSYHYFHIKNALEKAASYLPRVDAIGGSAAGVYVDNKVKVASLFRSVPNDVFEKEVKSMFLNIAKKWRVPFQVINDGDVTALAGALSLGKNAMFGIAMGTSEAAGYITPEGQVTGWLNELSSAPVDFNPGAARDEWTGDYGVGAQYFSQNAVNRLAEAAGYPFPPGMDLPEQLKFAQEKVEAGDIGAMRIFETIGVYLGYIIPYYKEFYDFQDLLILGRVTSGMGGDIILVQARRVLELEFPDLAGAVELHLPDEKSRRIGQAVAASSLPPIKTE
jgi:predicted NBD/HSP70 family sugar kinase